MSQELWIRLIVYIIPAFAVVYFLKIVVSVEKNQVNTWKHIQSYMELQRDKVVEKYTTNDLDHHFEEAGLLKAGITPVGYRLTRDILFAGLLFWTHFKYFLDPTLTYPRIVVAMTILIYCTLILAQKYILTFVLKFFKKKYNQRKNSEIFILQQVLSNEYANPKASKQSIYHLFLYMRKFMNVIQPAVDEFLQEYPRYHADKKLVFTNFGNRVGTPEAVALAEIIYQIDQTSPDEIKELLDKRYEELRTKRQQAYRSMMKERGTVAYILLYSGVLVVGLSAAVVYFMMYKELVSAAYNIL